MTFKKRIHVTQSCSGPNAACRKAFKAGRPVHISPDDVKEGSLVLPTYHYETEAQARAALTKAKRIAKVIRTDEQLYDARANNEPYIVPYGRIDPSRRIAPNREIHYIVKEGTVVPRHVLAVMLEKGYKITLAEVNEYLAAERR